LTKRAKTAENAFLSAYKVLAEAPDPYPLLEAALVGGSSVAVHSGSDENAHFRIKLLKRAKQTTLRRKSDVFERRTRNFAAVPMKRLP
jgi:homeobox protein cut-like